MPNLTGTLQAIAGDTSIVDTTAMHPVGTRAYGKTGEVYEYCSGVASCLAGSWVVIGPSGALTLLTTGLSGRIGVAMSANVASSYGWVQVAGFCSIALASSNGTITSGGGELQANSTVAGQVVAQATSTGSAAGDYIFGAWSYAAQPSSADDIIGSVYLNHPFLAKVVAVASS